MRRGGWDGCGLWVWDGSCYTNVPDQEPHPPMPSSPKAGASRIERADDLLSMLARVPDRRDPRGVRYPFAGLLAVAVSAVVAGARSFAAIGEWAADLPAGSLAVLGLNLAPETSNLRKLLARVDPEALDRQIGSWLWTRLHTIGGRRTELELVDDHDYQTILARLGGSTLRAAHPPALASGPINSLAPRITGLEGPTQPRLTLHHRSADSWRTGWTRAITAARRMLRQMGDTTRPPDTEEEQRIFNSDTYKTPPEEGEGTAVVLTALPLEFQEVVSRLDNVAMLTSPRGKRISLGYYRGGNRTWLVAVACTGRGNNIAALMNYEYLQELEPELAVFIGIAGGLRDVAVGDVVIADRVFNYESGKVTDAGFLSRSDSLPSDEKLVDLFIHVAARSRYRDRIHFGPIVAGEKVFASSSNSVVHDLRRDHSDALAVDMEGYGFLAAAQRSRHTPAIVIRGVSDLLADKLVMNDPAQQRMGARIAAEVFFEGLGHLEGRLLAREPTGSTARIRSLFGSVKAADMIDGSRSARQVLEVPSVFATMSATRLQNLASPPADPEIPGMEIYEGQSLGAGKYRVVRSLGSRPGKYIAEMIAQNAVIGTYYLEGIPKEVCTEALRCLSALSTVQHPRLIPCTDVIDAGDESLFAYPLHGMTLTEHLHASPLSPTSARSLWAQVADALYAMHSHQMAHGSVKPTAIMGSVDDWRIRSTPAGLAGRFFGAPAYSAPEFIRDGTASLAGGVFALAATILTALGLEGPGARCTTLRGISHLPVAWRALLNDCLNDSAEERPDIVDVRTRVLCLPEFA